MAVYIGDLKETSTREKRFDENGATNLQISLETILFEMVWTYIKNSCILEHGQRGKHYEAIACEEVCSFSQMEFDKIVCFGLYVDLFVQPIAEQFTIFRTKFTNEYEA